jgi:hypothetical protein
MLLSLINPFKISIFTVVILWVNVFDQLAKGLRGGIPPDIDKFRLLAL